MLFSIKVPFKHTFCQKFCKLALIESNFEKKIGANFIYSQMTDSFSIENYFMSTFGGVQARYSQTLGSYLRIMIISLIANFY